MAQNKSHFWLKINPIFGMECITTISVLNNPRFQIIFMIKSLIFQDIVLLDIISCSSKSPRNSNTSRKHMFICIFLYFFNIISVKITISRQLCRWRSLNKWVENNHFFSILACFRHNPIPQYGVIFVLVYNTFCNIKI